MWLERFWKSLLAPVPARVQLPVAFNPSPDYDVVNVSIPRYPPFDDGLPCVPVARVMDTQREYIRRIQELGVDGAPEAIANLVRFVHLLPASHDSAFRGAGGLFRLCLETAFHSYQAAQGKIFAAAEPTETRSQMEKRWQVACFYAGLCCELGRAVTTAVVTTEQGEVWTPFEPLANWFESRHATRYFLRPPRNQSSATDYSSISGTVVGHVIPRAVLNSLSQGSDRGVISTMLSTIGRVNDAFSNTSVLAKTVRKARDQLIERDLRQAPMSFGSPLVGMHLEPYLIGAMRELVANGTWQVNAKMARVHLAPDGCFIFWLTGVPELLDLLRTNSIVGVPTEPRTLAETLAAEGVLERNQDGQVWWYVKTPFGPRVQQVVKLSDPTLLFLDERIPEGLRVYDHGISVAADSVASAGDGASVPEPGAAVGPQELLSFGASSVSEPSPPSTPPHPAPSSAPAHPKKATRSQKPRSASDAPVRVDAEVVSPVAATPTSQSDHSHSEPPSEPQKLGPDPVYEIVKDRAMAMAFIAIRDSFNAGQLPDVFPAPHGICLPQSLLASRTEQTPLIACLRAAGCLYVAKGESKVWYEINSPVGASVKCAVLLFDAAEQLGFLCQPGDSA